MPPDLRIAAYRHCRELLWALDAAWYRRPGMQCVTSFLRYFGGPLHMMMRRYRFVEENLTVGQQEDASVVDQTRNHYKLWNRIDAGKAERTDSERYELIVANSDTLLYPGLVEEIQKSEDGNCGTCLYRSSYGAETTHRFGGVQLCASCQTKWEDYLLSIRERAEKVFPELATVSCTPGPLPKGTHPVRSRAGDEERPQVCVR